MKEILKELNIRIEQENDKILIYKNNCLHKVLTDNGNNATFNYVYDWWACIRHIKKDGNMFTVTGRIFVPNITNNLEGCYFVVGNNSFPISFQKCGIDKTRGYYVEFKTAINVLNLDISIKTQAVYFNYENSQGKLKIRMNWQYLKQGDSIYEHPHRKIQFSDYILEGNQVYFFYQTVGNYVSFSSRESNVTDSRKFRCKIKIAKLLASVMCIFVFSQKVVFFEKFCERYEESAATLFEYCIANGNTKVVYIINKNSKQYNKIPQEYRKYVIDKFSFKHFFYFFTANTFVSTESMNHIVELNIYNSDVRKRINKKKYSYIFLQHGVMYMYSLENRGTFIKGEGMPMNTRIVVSSRVEAEHIVEAGKFFPGDIIYSGLPKFDSAMRYDNADKIVIMPTSRDFEYNTIKNEPQQSRYYFFVNKIIKEIPKDLLLNVIFIPHPLIKDYFRGTSLSKYIPEEFSYEEILRNTKLLITDYSSISYDAFYRGSNVLFCWQDKEFCLQQMNYSLMLNDNNAFGDICYEYGDLANLIKKNYYNDQDESHKKKYKRIVEFDDNNNTARCFNELEKSNVFKKTNIRQKLNEEMLHGVGNKIYTGFKRTHNKAYVLCDDRVLTEGVDYKRYYIKSKGPGYGIMLLRGIGNYKGIVIKRYKIRENIRHASVNKISEIPFEKIKEMLNVTINNKRLVLGKDYIVEVKDMGDDFYEVLVKGRGKYGGLKQLYFRKD